MDLKHSKESNVRYMKTYWEKTVCDVLEYIVKYCVIKHLHNGCTDK